MQTQTMQTQTMQTQTMQKTKDVASLLNIPPAALRRMKSKLGGRLAEGSHFVKEGTLLFWTPVGVDLLSVYAYDNPFVPFVGLLDSNELWNREEEVA